MAVFSYGLLLRGKGSLLLLRGLGGGLVLFVLVVPDHPALHLHQDEDEQGDEAHHQDNHRQGDDEVLEQVLEEPADAVEGVRQAVADLLPVGPLDGDDLGQLLHLPDGQVHGAVGNLMIQVVQVGLDVLDLVAHVGQAALDGDEILHRLALGQDLQQAVFLGAQGGDAGLHVVVLGGHILHAGVGVGDGAQGGQGAGDGLKGGGGYPDNVIGGTEILGTVIGAGIVPAGDVAGLDKAAGLLHQLLQARQGVLEGHGLHGDAGGVDELFGVVDVLLGQLGLLPGNGGGVVVGLIVAAVGSPAGGAGGGSAVGGVGVVAAVLGLRVALGAARQEGKHQNGDEGQGKKTRTFHVGYLLSGGGY